ncbi:hypothetical protein BJ165DRAFT_1609456 [Panaeolus papilionaceus]|nr:hypothetical protein BJ165DRAFT_1609456 [Panaeolus papilionaceus]
MVLCHPLWEAMMQNPKANPYVDYCTTTRGNIPATIGSGVALETAALPLHTVAAQRDIVVTQDFTASWVTTGTWDVARTTTYTSTRTRTITSINTPKPIVTTPVPPPPSPTLPPPSPSFATSSPLTSVSSDTLNLPPTQSFAPTQATPLTTTPTSKSSTMPASISSLPSTGQGQRSITLNKRDAGILALVVTIFAIFA